MEALTLAAPVAVSDSDLLARYASTQDPEAFEAIVQRHTPRVYSCCMRVLNDAHAADDATQAVFLILSRKAVRLPAGTSLAGWLYRTAEWTALEARRTLAMRGRHEREAAKERAALNTSESGRQSDGDDLLRSTVRELLSFLPDRQRDAIVLHFIDGRPEAEVAAELGCAVSTVGTRISRGLTTLRDGLRRRGFQVAPALVPVLLTGLKGSAVPAGLATSVSSACLGKVAATPGVINLAARAAHAAFWTKVKSTVAIVVASTVLIGSGGIVAHRMLSSPGPDDESLLDVTGADIRKPGVAWETTLDGETPSHLLAGDRIVLSIKKDDKQWLEARRIADGGLLWKNESGGGSLSTFVESNRTVLCVSGASLRAVDVDSGFDRWHSSSSDNRPRSPAVWDGKRVYCCAMKPRSPDVSSGQSPDTAVAPEFDSVLCCMDSDTGRTFWEAPLDVGEVKFAPAAGRDRIYVSGKDGIACVPKNDRAMLWSQSRSGLGAALAYNDGALVPSGELVRVSGNDGGSRWRVSGRGSCGVTLSGTRAFTALAQNAFAAVSVETGRVMWSQKFPAEIKGHAAAPRSIYAVSQDDTLTCLERRDGSVRWKLPVALNKWTPTPLMTSDHVYLCFQNKIICFGENTGKK
jgi:RNA polymerase sigma factor (sigma-70 family)